MQDLNEDLDDLFRHAVDKFELKPVVSKWDELSGRIISIKRPSTLADTIRSKYRKWMMLVVLFILIPVAIISVMPLFNGYKTTKAKAQGAVVQAEIKKNAAEIANQKANTEHHPVSRVQDLLVKPSEKTNEKPSETSSVESSNKPYLKSVETVAPEDPNYDKNERLIPEKNLAGLQRMEAGSAFTSEAATKSKPVTQIYSDDPLVEAAYSINTLSLFEQREPLTLHLSHQKNLPLQHLDYPRRQGFYLGLVAGPMLTQVKHQGLKKSGFDFGLLVGYTINKKFSIETGLFYTKQYYYVSGPYYNEFAGINYASSLEGSRNAIEMPLTLKYNIICKPKGNFFITTGVSSYVGVSDKILIHVMDSIHVPIPNHFDYGVTSLLPSYINISLGYEYKIGKFANIRIEPYFQIPLNSNTGNSFKTQNSGGSIPVFNSGIHIGISRFIR